MSDVLNLSRRDFVRTGVFAGGGLLLGVYLPALGETGAAAAEGASSGAAAYAPNAFVRIGTDDVVTVIVPHSEMGQGPYTSLPMLVAEELDADWSKVRPEAAPVDPAYNHTAFGVQATGGSTSTWSEWERMRKAGATARAMLVLAAAASWEVDPSTCRAEKGQVLHPDSGRKLSYGALAEAASRLDPPENVPLKDPSAFEIIGTPVKRLDTTEKVNGTGVFGLDVTVPGMLVAVVERAPVFGAKMTGFDAAKAKAVPGVKHVVPIDRGVAVVADGYWNARKGRRALSVEWDMGPLAGLDSGKQRAQYAEMAGRAGATARKEGDVPAAMGTAAKTLSAEYELPYLAHATMEPMNCVADVRGDGCDIWTGTQMQTFERMTAAAITGLDPSKIRVHTMLLGGGFGRRAVIDCHFTSEAVQISKAIGSPVKVVWAREDDMRGGYYRPAAHHAMSGALDAGGNLAAWQHRIVCQSFIMGTPFEAMVVKEGVDATAVEGAAADLVYDIPNLLVEWHEAPGGVPTLWWRSVGHSHTAFAVESFLDEMAHAAGKDPLAFRLALMGNHPRPRRALELAAEKAGWGSAPPPGRARGLAVHESFGSSVAHVAEVSVSNAGKVRVHKVVCAIDCGPVVNPGTIRAQMEGAAVFGLSAALYGEITFENGRVKQSNFHNYPMVRIDEAPEVETHIVPSTERMGGVGEPGVPPLTPAVANAVFAATGKRIRKLPIRPEDLKQG